MIVTVSLHQDSDSLASFWTSIFWGIWDKFQISYEIVWIFHLCYKYCNFERCSIVVLLGFSDVLMLPVLPVIDLLSTTMCKISGKYFPSLNVFCRLRIILFLFFAAWDKELPGMLFNLIRFLWYWDIHTGHSDKTCFPSSLSVKRSTRSILLVTSLSTPLGSRLIWSCFAPLASFQWAYSGSLAWNHWLYVGQVGNMPSNHLVPCLWGGRKKKRMRVKARKWNV